MKINTAEQDAILSAAASTADNIMLKAYAGCGKTSTLELIERCLPTGPILYLAFNKKIAEDATTRMLSTTKVTTFNSLGHRIWATSRNLSLNPKKTQEIVQDIIKQEKSRTIASAMWDDYFNVVQGVAIAKAIGYIPSEHQMSKRSLCDFAAVDARLDEPASDLCWDLIDRALLESIRQAYAGSIDFNDQIYMPALFGGIFPQFPFVMVDEVQDLNPTNIAMLYRLTKHRLIGVGDPNQNIYGFRGAASNAMSEISEKFEMLQLPLSISFRCPEAIVRAARWRVPDFKWLRSGGHVTTRDSLNLLDIPDNSVIICRNNAPLFGLAMRLLVVGKSVRVAGSDIGPKVIGQMKRLGSLDLKQSAVLASIDEWEVERPESKTAKDTAGCMRVFAQHGENLNQAIAYAEHLLKQTGRIQLMTGHKSKGLEFPNVFHLDPWLLGDDKQDLNLKYVILTRSSDRYTEINSANIRG